MIISSTLLLVFGILLLFNIVIILYAFNVRVYQKKGLKYLQSSKKVINKNDDDENSKEIEIEILIFESGLLASKGFVYIIYIAFQLNLLLFSIYLFPNIELGLLLFFLELCAATVNALIIISLMKFSKIKNYVNAICSAYDVLLQSYEYIDDVEEES